MMPVVNIRCRYWPRRCALEVYWCSQSEKWVKGVAFSHSVSLPRIQHRNITNKFKYTESKLKVITDRTGGE